MQVGLTDAEAFLPPEGTESSTGGCAWPMPPSALRQAISTKKMHDVAEITLDALTALSADVRAGRQIKY